MKKQPILFLLITVIAYCQLLSQAPAIEWESCFGGNATDNSYAVCGTSDGGMLAAFTTKSNSDDFPSNYGLNDIYIIRFDAMYNLIWSKHFGGSNEDYANSIIESSDGKIIVAGYTRSSDFDVTGNHGNHDCWVLKLDTDGTTIWKKCYGGSGFDAAYDLIETSDGGYIIAASNSSTNGQVTGHHGSNIYSDAWIVKLSSAGIIEWQKSIGGTDGEAAEDIIEVADGFVFSGYTSSNDGDANAAFEHDYYIVKLDFSGNIIWTQAYGGSQTETAHSIIQLEDGNYIVAGESDSWNGDINDHHGAEFFIDAWILKLDALGELIWKHSIGGSGTDGAYSIAEYDEATVLIAGYAGSADGDFSGLGYDAGDMWVSNINKSDGLINWQDLMGGPGGEKCYDMKITPAGGYLFSGTSSANGGDVSGFKGGAWDAWIVAWPSTDCIPGIETCNSLDDNCNGLIDDEVVETISISAGGATTFCQGGNVLLSATYSGTSIQWKKNGSNIAGATSTTYSVNKSGNYSAVTTSPCGTATSSIINVTVNKNPNASISAGGATTFCAGGSVTLTEIPVAGSTYQWYKGASLIAGATSTNYFATTAGNYKCRVTKTATGCYKNSDAIYVTVPCKEGEIIEDGVNNFSIYPNPTQGQFSLHGINTSAGNILIYNSIGELIYSKGIQTGEINELVSIENLPAGIYYVRIDSFETNLFIIR